MLLRLSADAIATLDAPSLLHTPHPCNPSFNRTYHLLQLLLRSQLVGVTAFLLAAISRSRRQTGVAFPADHFVAIVFAGEGFEGGFDDTAAKTENEVECGFLRVSQGVSGSAL